MQTQTQTIELKPVGLAELKNRLSAADYELFRRAAVMECHVSTATWSNWTTGKYTPETKYQSIIDLIAARFGLVVFAPPAGEGGGEQ